MVAGSGTGAAVVKSKFASKIPVTPLLESGKVKEVLGPAQASGINLIERSTVAEILIFCSKYDLKIRFFMTGASLFIG
jgi:hypothetical protein